MGQPFSCGSLYYPFGRITTVLAQSKAAENGGKRKVGLTQKIQPLFLPNGKKKGLA